MNFLIKQAAPFEVRTYIYLSYYFLNKTICMKYAGRILYVDINNI